MTFPDGSAISATAEDTTLASKSYVNGLYAPKENPVFSGNNVTFPDSSTITDYLKTSNATSTYLTQTNAASTYLTQTNAASTYAPKVSPTFTGNIVLNGNVTLAETSANSLTLNNNLSLCSDSSQMTITC